MPECYASLLSRLALAGQEALQFWPVLTERAVTYTNWTTCKERTLQKVLDMRCLTTLEDHVVKPENNTVVFGGMESTEDTEVLKKILRKLNGENVIDLSQNKDKHVLDIFKSSVFDKQNCLFREETLTGMCLRNLNVIEGLEDHERLTLLKILSAKPACLAGLPLLPLRSGAWEKFTQGANSKFLFPLPEVKTCIPGSFKSVVTVPKELETVARGWAEKKQFGIELVSPTSLASALTKSFPTSWTEGDNTEVEWNPSDENQPSVANLKDVWKVLTENPNTNILAFEGLPLVPEKPYENINPGEAVKLMKLHKNKKFLDCSDAPAQLQDLCKTFSGSQVLLWNPVVQLSRNLVSYVTKFSGQILLDILQKNKTSIEQMLLTDRNLCSIILDVLIRQQITTPLIKKFLISLPLLTTLDGSPTAVSDLHSVVYVTKKDSMDDFLLSSTKRGGYTILLCEEPTQQQLVSGLIRQLDKSFAEKMVFNLIQKDPINEEHGILWVLRNLLSSQWSYSLSDVAFLPSNGKYFKMSDLFLSSDFQVATLMRGEKHCFIDETSPYRAEEEVMRKSTKLLKGLKTFESITEGNLLNIAQTISLTPAAVDDNKLKGLLDLAMKKNILPKLAHLNIFPAKPRPDMSEHPEYLPWKSERPVLVPASSLLPSKFSKVAGCVSIICAEEFSHFLMSTNQQKSLTPDLLLMQLECLVKSNQVWVQGLEALFAMLDQYCGQRSVVESMKQRLAALPAWIPTEKGFKASHEVSLNSEDVRSFHPYISSPIQGIKNFRIIKELGIKESFELSDLMQILANIKNNFNGKKLKDIAPEWKDNDRVIVNICKKLDDAHLKNKSLLLPTLHKGLLTFRPHQDVYWDDVSDESKKDLLQDLPTDCSIIHLENLTPTLAMKMGLKPVTEILHDITQLDPAFEEFGQHQTMTNRIKEILREYPVGPVLFQEQIQNSEDAKATNVKFFLDTNDNADCQNKLLGESMMACHGPSLWIYNNAKFTEEDFKNILNVGGATKKEKKDKIGSFGIGFNSVYHLTDVPSIVSGKSK